MTNLSRRACSWRPTVCAPSSYGKRVRFAETNELVAGFWLWQVKSIDEAVEWVKRCPNPMPTDSEIEILPLFDMEDFA